MARGDLQVQNFVKGLHTESSPINFPAGASIDETNFVLRRDGTRDKRLGLDMEPGGVLTTTNLSEEILAAARVQHYRWSTPNGNPNIEIGVVQIGSKVFFINLYNDAVSSTILNGTNGVVIGTRNDALMSFATINNYLVMVSNANNDPVLFSYDENTDTITTETAPIMVRDIWGVDDGITPDGRPVTLSDAHKYNLRNQGWTADITSTCGTDAIDCTFSTLGVYPSNSDHWSSGRIENLTDPNVFKYDPSLYEKVSINTGQQAKGHYIIPLYSRGAGRFSNTGLTLPTDAEQGRITTIAAHQGRLFYSGILSNINSGDSRSPNLSGAVLFSQTFTSKGDLVNCYPVADPTNVEINDIIDTDGGIINIPDASLILKLHASSAGLYVFAVNGVWIISSDDNGFRATSYSIRKITNIGLLAKNSVVEAGDTLIYWAEGGIYAITPQNDAGGTTFNVNNITEQTIQRMYNSYPDVFKRNVRGFYDAPANKARWLMYSPSTRIEGDPIEGHYVPSLAPVTVPGETSVTSLGGTYPTVLRIDDDRFFLLYRHTATTNLRGVVCTVNQTTLAISVGVPTMIFSTENYPDYSGWVMNLVDTDKIILIHRDADKIFTGVIITVSGTSFSVGSTQSIITESSSVIYPTLSRMSATKYIMQYNYADGFNKAAALVLDISGDTITPGSIVRPGYASAVYLKHVTDSTALAVTSEGSDTLMVVSSDGTTVSYNETGKFVTTNPVFQAGSVTLYMYDNHQGSNVFVISARSVFEAPSRVMMRVLEVNGTIISSEDTSEFIETTITDNSGNSRWNIPIVMTSSMLAHTYITGTGDMTVRTYNYSVTGINARTSKLTVDAGSFLTNPSAVKLNDEVFIWAAKNLTGEFKMQAVRVS